MKLISPRALVCGTAMTRHSNQTLCGVATFIFMCGLAIGGYFYEPMHAEITEYTMHVGPSVEDMSKVQLVSPHQMHSWAEDNDTEMDSEVGLSSNSGADVGEAPQPQQAPSPTTADEYEEFDGYDEFEMALMKERKQRPIARIDIMCCGYGDRFKDLFTALAQGRTVAVHMGPCSNVTGNVFSHIFSKLPAVTMTDSCNLTYVGDPSPGTLVARIEESDEHPRPPAANPYPKCEIKDAVEGFYCPREKNAYDDYYGYLACPMVGASTRHMMRHVSPHLQAYVDDFKRKHDWDKQPVIAWHLRYGNPSEKGVDRDYAAKKRGKAMEDLDVYLKGWLGQIQTLADRMGWTKYKVYVATDTKKVFDRLMEIAPEKIIWRQDTYFHQYAHPLVFSNLRTDNAGKKCEIRWFEDPMLDLLLLSSGRALVSSITSGFMMWPAISLFDRGLVVCRADPAGTPFLLECQQRHVEKFKNQLHRPPPPRVL